MHVKPRPRQLRTAASNSFRAISVNASDHVGITLVHIVSAVSGWDKIGWTNHQHRVPCFARGRSSVIEQLILTHLRECGMSLQRITDARACRHMRAACHSERSRGIPLSPQRITSQDPRLPLHSTRDDDDQSPNEMSTSRAVCTSSPLGGTSLSRLTARAIGT